MQWIHTVLTAHSLTLTLTVVLFISVIRKSSGGMVHYIFAAILLFGMIWPFTNGISEYLTIYHQPVGWVGSISGLAIQGLAYATYLLCEYLPAGKRSPRSHWRMIPMALVTLALCPLVFSEDWISARRSIKGISTASYGVYYFALNFWGTFTVVMGLALLFLKSRAEKDQRARIQASFFLLGATASLALAVIFSFVLPVLGMDKYFFLGVNSIIAFVVLTTYAILYYRLLDLRTALLRLSLRLSISIILSILIYMVFLFFILNRSISDFSLDLVIALSVFFATALLFARQVLPRIDRLFFFKPPPAEKIVIRLFDEASRGESMEKFLSGVYRGLQEHFPVKNGVIFAADYQNRLWLQTMGQDVNFKKEHVRLFSRLLRAERLPAAFLALVDKNISLERDWESELEADESRGVGRRYNRTLKLVREFLGEMKADGRQLCMPLLYGKRICGMILLGEKSGELPYYDRDLEFLNAVRLALGVLLEYRRNYNQIHLMREEAQTELLKLTDLIGGGKIKTRMLADKTFIYKSRAMHEIYETAAKIADNSQPVLITGETGTGKEIISRLIHELSSKKDQPFVAMNCAAISKSLWEDELFGHVKGAYTDARAERPGRVKEAAGGVLFLDEIGEMPLETQAKLLRLLAEGKYSPVGSDKFLEADCRFIFATNRELPDMIKEKEFREDLFYRINVFQVQLPPLRRRQEDIGVLLEYFITNASKDLGFNLQSIEPAALDILMRYDWPGNIRELENFVIRAAALSEEEVLTAASLPLSMKKSSGRSPRIISAALEMEESIGLKEMLDDFTRTAIMNTLKKTGGNRTKAAEILKIKRGSLLYRMKELDIQ